MSDYDNWRLQTPEEYFGTEGGETILCCRCSTTYEDHGDRCETCEGDNCGICEGEGCKYEQEES